MAKRQIEEANYEITMAVLTTTIIESRESRHSIWSIIGLYRENAIAIDSEAKDPFDGNVYYVTMQITLHILEFAR